MDEPDFLLSVVIPAYHEERTLASLVAHFYSANSSCK